MAEAPSSPPVTPIEDEKKVARVDGADVLAGTTSSIIIDEEAVSSTDGDDALMLAGTHAHHFEDAYYRRLRLKIVSLY